MKLSENPEIRQMADPVMPIEEKYKSSSSSRGCGFVKKSNKSHKHAIKKGYESWENRF